MYCDASEFDSNQLANNFYDICIIGGGAAGIAMATQLIGSKKQVLVLSSGLETDFNPPPSPDRESIYKGIVGNFMRKVDPEFLTRSRLRMYGGTTNHFNFWARPLDEADLQPRPGYRDAYWPISRKELDAYYPTANEFGNYGPFNYDDIGFWEKVFRASAFPEKPGDQLKNAVFHAQEDRYITHFQLQRGQQLKDAPNVTVLFNANVLRINTSADRRHVTSVDYAAIINGRPGIPSNLQANRYVLALGGIESVRLLQLSGDLGNNNRKLLGRGFMLHPVIGEAAKVDFNPPITQFIRNFYAYQRVTLDQTGDLLKSSNQPTPPPYDADDLEAQQTFQAWGILAPTVAAMDNQKTGNFRAMLNFSPLGDSCSINMNWEQIPNENSTIQIDPSQTDPVFGQPVVNVNWNLLEADKQTIIKGLSMCEEFFKQRGGQNFRITTDLSGGPEQWVFDPSPRNRNPLALNPGDHHMGAMRMSDAAENGIVNADLKFHSVDNLYAAGCSVFPTSGYANPTLTIVALALRLADHLKNTP